MTFNFLISFLYEPARVRRLSGYSQELTITGLSAQKKNSLSEPGIVENIVDLSLFTVITIFANLSLLYSKYWTSGMPRLAPQFKS